jgi:hypothetical protein
MAVISVGVKREWAVVEWDAATLTEEKQYVMQDVEEPRSK